MYATNEAHPRESFWADIVRVPDNVNLPWLVARDFNTILEYGEKFNEGEPVNFDNTELFSCTNACNLQDMKLTSDNHVGNLKDRLMSKRSGN